MLRSAAELSDVHLQWASVYGSEVSKKIYDAPFLLNIINSFIKEPDLQLKNILNKLRLLLRTHSFNAFV